LPEHHTVQVSPRHSVTIDDDYYTLIRRAPEQDFVVRTLARKMAGDAPLVTGDLVIAGRSTRDRHPLANTYAIHFRKTYYPGHLRGDTQVEFDRHSRASVVIGIPTPIGHAGGTFRSCLLPGRPFDQILPFGSEPAESNIRHAERLTLGAAAGLWLLAERMMSTLTTLHEAGLTHGDAELHNFIVCHGPLDVIPIDFDMAIDRDSVGEEEWQRRCAADLEPLLKIAVFLQCALGAQEGPLAVRSLGEINRLFARDEPFRRAIDARARLFAPALPVP
jgi:hypothetical protein